MQSQGCSPLCVPVGRQSCAAGGDGGGDGGDDDGGGAPALVPPEPAPNPAVHLRFCWWLSFIRLLSQQRGSSSVPVSATEGRKGTGVLELCQGPELQAEPRGLDWDPPAASPLLKPLGSPAGGCRCGVRGNPWCKLELMCLLDLCRDTQELVDAGVIGQM